MKFSKDDGQKYDVVAVSLTDNHILWVDGPKTLPNAEAAVMMAIIRQAVEDRFVAVVPHGLYKEGDEWKGRGGEEKCA